jgi:diguanylate cyclase (GGDEF)-like protein
VVSLAEVIESKHATERLKTLAFFDTLTGLHNRNHFCHRLKYAIACANRYKNKFALLFCDIDRFKSINDSLGHKAGDILLKETASRLKTTVRESDIAARLSGDEFAIILSRINHEQEAVLVARKICSSLNIPFLIMNNGCIITVSIGIAVFPDDGQYMNKLLVNADTAMYYVKKYGKAAFHFYNPEMNKEAEEYAKIETSLYEALNRDELALYFQTEIDLTTPLYKLKIDNSFIRRIDTDNKSYSLVKSITSMGHSLGLRVIAEGVERKKQMDILNTLRCDEAQGFFISKPLAKKNLITYVMKNRGKQKKSS